MECKEIRELLSPYLDGILEWQEREKIEDHLKLCPKCQEELNALKKTVDLLSSLEEVEPPPHLLERVKEKIQTESPLKRFLEVLTIPRWKIPVEAMGLAAVFLLIIIIGPKVYFKSIRPSETVFEPRIAFEMEDSLKMKRGPELPRVTLRRREGEKDETRMIIKEEEKKTEVEAAKEEEIPKPVEDYDYTSTVQREEILLAKGFTGEKEALREPPSTLSTKSLEILFLKEDGCQMATSVKLVYDPIKYRSLSLELEERKDEIRDSIREIFFRRTGSGLKSELLPPESLKEKREILSGIREQGITLKKFLKTDEEKAESFSQVRDEEVKEGPKIMEEELKRQINLILKEGEIEGVCLEIAE
ncbi:TPA: hypothetical protein DCX15_04185 [bacterium]|nr:hypothetical protein [bacterium]